MGDLEEIRKKLEERLDQLVPRIARIEGHLRSPGNRDWQENATEKENDEVLEQLGATERLEVEEIRSALARIGSGEYGRCTGCGEAIADGRLDALPYATLCIDCAA